MLHKIRVVRQDDASRPRGHEPIMVTDGRFADERIAAEFEQRGKKLDPRLHDFIYAKIGEAGIVISGSAG